MYLSKTGNLSTVVPGYGDSRLAMWRMVVFSMSGSFLGSIEIKSNNYKHNGQATSWIIKYINTKGNMIPLQHTKKSEFGFFVNLYENSFWAKQKNFRSWTEHHDEGNPGAYPWCQFCGGPVLGPSDRSLRSSLDYSAVLSTCHWTASGPVTGSAAVAFWELLGKKPIKSHNY